MVVGLMAALLVVHGLLVSCAKLVASELPDSALLHHFLAPECASPALVSLGRSRLPFSAFALELARDQVPRPDDERLRLRQYRRHNLCVHLSTRLINSADLDPIPFQLNNVYHMVISAAIIVVLLAKTPRDEMHPAKYARALGVQVG